MDISLKDREFISSVSITDIPWRRLVCSSGRAGNFPQWLNDLSELKSRSNINFALSSLSQDMEHQSTLWHCTPFALIFAVRALDNALQQLEQNELADFLAGELIDWFAWLNRGINEIEAYEHAAPLEHFADLLDERYLLPDVNSHDNADDNKNDVTDESGDEDGYENGDEDEESDDEDDDWEEDEDDCFEDDLDYPDNVFYSFYYYSKVAIESSREVIIRHNAVLNDNLRSLAQELFPDLIVNELKF